MSMPSSSEAVATSAFSSPRFRRCSASRRRSRDRLPWCAVTFSSPRRCDNWRAARSAWRRVLTKTSVLRCSPTRFAMRSYTCSQSSPDITAPSGAAGTSSARSRSRLWPLSITAQAGRADASRRPAPTKKRATSSRGRCVADKPTRVNWPAGERIEPLQRQRQVRASLVADQRVDLVDDDRARRATAWRGRNPSPAGCTATRAW